jgi:hypothetical protein
MNTMEIVNWAFEKALEERNALHDMIIQHDVRTQEAKPEQPHTIVRFTDAPVTNAPQASPQPRSEAAANKGWPEAEAKKPEHPWDVYAPPSRDNPLGQTARCVISDLQARLDEARAEMHSAYKSRAEAINQRDAVRDLNTVLEVRNRTLIKKLQTIEVAVLSD